MISKSELLELLRCPRCGLKLEQWAADTSVRCSNQNCVSHGEKRYPVVNGQPVLVVFEKSVLKEKIVLETEAASVVHRRRDRIAFLVRRIAYGAYPVATKNCQKFIDLLQKVSDAPSVLIVGGGTVGKRAAELYEADTVRRLAFDIYSSAQTDFVADAHDIPLPDASVDGVWIQAVLEHVIEPERVVSEIHRVLKPGGIVYAETAFMQQVHEGAYDFVRYTERGHRWLFRSFQRIELGSVMGPGLALLWSIKYALAAFFRHRKIGFAVGMMFFFWVRFLDQIAPKHFATDAASAIFFLGRKTDETISQRDLIRGFHAF